jgi:HEAT repeat protein
LAEEDDPRVAGAIFTSLIRCNSPDAAAAVAPYLRSDEVRLRTGALDALRAMPVAAERQIEILLDDCDPDVRLLTCEVLRGLPGEQATSLACALLDRETEPNVCGAIIDVLAEVGVADALPALARCGERFADEPFLVFSVRTAIGRIHAQPDRTRDSELGG